MSSVNFYRTYQFYNIYDHVKELSGDLLGKYLDYPDLFKFNDENKRNEEKRTSRRSPS